MNPDFPENYWLYEGFGQTKLRPQATAKMQKVSGVFFTGQLSAIAPEANWAVLDQSDFMSKVEGTFLPSAEQAWSLEKQFKAAFGYAQKVSELCQRLETIEGALVEVVRKLERSAQPQQALWIPINTFAPEPYEVLKPLTAVVSPSEDGFEAGLFDADLFASGDTESEAVANLKSVIIDTFEAFEQLGESKLGPGPLQQKRTMATLVRRST